MPGLIRKWWPSAPRREQWEGRLARFYAENLAYHAMTAGGDKTTHPQTRLLMNLVRPQGIYAEFGCGSGQICNLVGSIARVHGFDVSTVVIREAMDRNAGENARYYVAEAQACPLPDGSMDGAYSFEVLEHLWNPVAALAEMARVVRPGGFILVSCPNWFSLDLHLRKRLPVRLVEIMLALARYAQDRLSRTDYINLEPDLDVSAVYPDCDMIASLIPCNVPGLMRRLGCRLVFLDTFFMCEHREGSATTLRHQRRARLPFIKWHGDHILFLAMK